MANMKYEFTEEDVKEWFSQFGVVDSVRIVTDKDGKSRGFGFVEMATDEGTEAVKTFTTAMNHNVTMMGWKNVNLKIHDEKRNKNKYQNSNNGYGPGNHNSNRNMNYNNNPNMNNNNPGMGTYGTNNTAQNYTQQMPIQQYGIPGNGGGGLNNPPPPPPPVMQQQPYMQQPQQQGMYNQQQGMGTAAPPAYSAAPVAAPPAYSAAPVDAPPSYNANPVDAPPAYEAFDANAGSKPPSYTEQANQQPNVNAAGPPAYDSLYDYDGSNSNSGAASSKNTNVQQPQYGVPEYGARNNPSAQPPQYEETSSALNGQSSMPQQQQQPPSYSLPTTNVAVPTAVPTYNSATTNPTVQGAMTQPQLPSQQQQQPSYQAFNQQQPNMYTPAPQQQHQPPLPNMYGIPPVQQQQQNMFNPQGVPPPPPPPTNNYFLPQTQQPILNQDFGFGGGDDGTNSNKIFMKNLPLGTEVGELVEFIESKLPGNGKGRVRKANIQADKNPRVHWCFAHLEFDFPSDASYILSLNGNPTMNLKGRPISCVLYRPKHSSGNRDHFNKYGPGRGGRRGNRYGGGRDSRRDRPY